MLPERAHSLGGKKMAIILRQKALDDYYKDPNICKECGRIIEVGDRKVREIRKRSFVIKVVELSIIIGLNREAQNRLPKRGLRKAGLGDGWRDIPRRSIRKTFQLAVS